MPYCTKDDILAQISEEQLIMLTDDAGEGAVDDAVLARAIDDACAEIDSYARSQYPTPLSPVPNRIRAVAVDIALFDLKKRRMPELPQDDMRRAAYKDAVAWLVNLSKGTVSLGAEAPPPAAADLPQATTDKADRDFTTGKRSDGSRGTLDGF